MRPPAISPLPFIYPSTHHFAPSASSLSFVYWSSLAFLFSPLIVSPVTSPSPFPHSPPRFMPRTSSCRCSSPAAPYHLPAPNSAPSSRIFSSFLCALAPSSPSCLPSMRKRSSLAHTSHIFLSLRFAPFSSRLYVHLPWRRTPPLTPFADLASRSVRAHHRSFNAPPTCRYVFSLSFSYCMLTAIS